MSQMTKNGPKPVQVPDLPDPAPPPSPKKPRRIFVIRHAERVDISFGQQWTQHCFDSTGGVQVQAVDQFIKGHLSW